MFGQTAAIPTTTREEAVEYFDLQTFSWKSKLSSQLTAVEKLLSKQSWPILGTLAVGVFVATRSGDAGKRKVLARRVRRRGRRR